MSFLAPLYVAGALFVALPIILHLIRRTPRDRVLFSSLMFLRESPPRVTRRSRLENILLLILRGAALSLLACAFARPFLREPLLADAGQGGGQITAILLDTSASMRREDLWTQGVNHALRRVRELRPIDQVTVLTFDRGVHTIAGFDEWTETPAPARVNWVTDKLESLDPSWNSTRLGSALATAADAVDSRATGLASRGDVPDQLVVLISDMQKGADLSGLQQYEWPEHVRVEAIRVSPRQRTNASIQLIEDQDEVGDSGTSAGFRVRVTSASDSERGQFRLRWAGVDGPPIDVYVAPGRSRVVQMPAASAGDGAEQVVIEGDDQNFDNVMYTVSRRREAVNVLCVGGGPADDVKNLLYYFERAFPDTVWRSVRVRSHERGQPLSIADLADIRFAVLADAVPATSADALREFVATGGSLLCVLTQTEMGPSIARVLSIDDWPVEESVVRDYSMLGDIDFRHPLFAPFADPRYGDFTKIHFWHHRRVDAEALHDARVLARFDNRDPALIDVPLGSGHVLILTAGWHPADSQLAVSSKFVPLLGGMLDYAMGNREQPRSRRVGDPLPLEQPSAGPLRLRLPTGDEVELAAGSSEFRDTEQPGIYTVLGDRSPLKFAVNLEPAESDTDDLASEELEQAGVRLTGPTNSSRMEAGEAHRRQMHSVELESRQKLWRWLIVAVIALLLVETWLAGRTGTTTPAADLVSVV
jgi:hypothetical protein